MTPVIVGDLVCMYRRKKKGVGIVLEKTDDIGDTAGISPEAVVKTMLEFQRWRDRHTYREEIISEAPNQEMATLFFKYNGYEWCRKVKKKFARVRWFETPSEYENKAMAHQEAWVPTDWLRKL